MAHIAQFIRGGGFVMYPLLLLSIAAVVVIVERLIAFRQYGGAPGDLTADVVHDAASGRFDKAEERCKNQSGPLAACLLVVLRHRDPSFPTSEVERMVEETGQDYFMRLERFLPILDTTTTISPLLGLLGTIVGMIGAFNAIAAQAHHGNNDAVLAGVGEALYATATGLVIAVVCFAAYNAFAARLRTVTAQTEQGATRLINALHERRRAARAHAGGEDSRADAVEEAEHAIQAASRA